MGYTVMTNFRKQKGRPQMTTATKESTGTQALPRAIEELIDSSIDAMDKRTLKRFEKESKKILAASKHRGAEHGARRETA